MCLPFLRVASVLRHHMYNEELPEVLVEADEFVRLVYYLELVSHGMDRSKFNSSVVFTWKDEKLDFVEYWFEQFRGYAERSQISARNFLSELHIPWKQPKLLQLPYQYDKIFQVISVFHMWKKVCLLFLRLHSSFLFPCSIINEKPVTIVI